MNSYEHGSVLPYRSVARATTPPYRAHRAARARFTPPPSLPRLPFPPACLPFPALLPPFPTPCLPFSNCTAYLFPPHLLLLLPTLFSLPVLFSSSSTQFETIMHTMPALHTCLPLHTLRWSTPLYLYHLPSALHLPTCLSSTLPSLPCLTMPTPLLPCSTWDGLSDIQFNSGQTVNYV